MRALIVVFQPQDSCKRVRQTDFRHVVVVVLEHLLPMYKVLSIGVLLVAKNSAMKIIGQTHNTSFIRYYILTYCSHALESNLCGNWSSQIEKQKKASKLSIILHLCTNVFRCIQ